MICHFRGIHAGNVTREDTKLGRCLKIYRIHTNPHTTYDLEFWTRFKDRARRQRQRTDLCPIGIAQQINHFFATACRAFNDLEACRFK